MFKEHSLPKGKLVHRGKLIDLGAIRDTALLTIEGELDDISGIGQTEAAHELCSGIPDSRKHNLLIKDAGHYGIFSGRRWREKIYPQLRDFIASHATYGKPAKTQKARKNSNARA